MSTQKRTTRKSTTAKKTLKNKTAVAKVKKETAAATQKLPRHTPAKVYDEAETDAFIQEVSEEVKNDNLKVLWDKYGLFIILFVVLAVCAAVSFETIKSWRESKYQAQNEQYLSALQTQENFENTIQALEKIAAGDNGIYSELARIQIANILFEQNKIDEAENMLQVIVDNDELNSRIRHLAALKLATYKIDTASQEQMQTLLQPIVDENNSWSPLALDLLGMVAIRDGDIENARQIYTGLLNHDNISDRFKTRIQDMLSALNDM